MNETCDWCGHAVRAVYRASRLGQLYLASPTSGPFPRARTPALWIR